jgi:Virulence factor
LPELTVIYWRDIPVQVTAKDGTRTARRLLPDRFEKAVDAAAMQAGLVGSDEYLEHYRNERRECGADLESEVAAEAARLEEAISAQALRQLIRSGGTSVPG